MVHGRDGNTTVTATFSRVNLHSQKSFSKHKHVDGLTTNSSSSLAPWDMDFNGQWEMDRDLIGEFIKNENFNHGRVDKNHHQKQEIFYNINEEENVVIKCLPVELIEDPSLSFVVEKADDIDDIFNKRTNYQFEEWEEGLDEAANHHEYEGPINIKDSQTINLFKSKFDDNVKALWDSDIINPVPTPVADISTSFDANNNRQNNDYLSEEMNSLSLFHWNNNFNKPLQFKNENDKLYLNVVEFDKNNNGGISRSTSNNSINDNKFIKSGFNLQQSIWSDNETKVDSDDSFSNKEVRNYRLSI